MRKWLLPLLALLLILVPAFWIASAAAQPQRPKFDGDVKLDWRQMRAWFQRTTPNKAHKALAHLKGNWRAEGQVWMMPDLPPLALTGKSYNRWILGERFIESRFTGEAGGLVFEGVATEGYDNAAGHYVATWKDSMNTAVLYFTGNGEGDGDRRVLTAPGLDPLSGDRVTVKGITTRLDDDQYRYESFRIDGEGQEFKMLEILFTRDLRKAED